MRENTGVAVAIAAVAAFTYTIWAAVVVAIVWTGITVYAIVKWIGAPEDHASATTLLVMLVGLVTLVPLLLGIAIYLVSKPMRYARKRAKNDAEQLTLPIPDEAA
jgi:heme/copper-type cytochrome/quinol oxidase subunit 2